MRFAPSPTGFLHVGSARTFIFNWLYARRNHGTMILRLDDTDVERNTDASVNSIFEGLKWLGLGWDEEYKQSERGALHRQTAEAIFQKGLAYRDFTPAHTGDSEKSGAQGTWLFNPGMRELSREESDRRAAAGEPFALRFRVPREAGQMVQIHRCSLWRASESRRPTSKISLCFARTACLRITSRRAPTMPILRISHIIRGQDHLSNTFKHVLIFEAAGAAPAAVRPSSAAGRAGWNQAFKAPPWARGERDDLSRCRISSRSVHQLSLPARLVAEKRSRTDEPAGIDRCVFTRRHQSRECRREFQRARCDAGRNFRSQGGLAERGSTFEGWRSKI